MFSSSEYFFTFLTKPQCVYILFPSASIISKVVYHPENRVLQPSPNCSLCPRLLQYRLKNRSSFPQWHNAPVKPFGGLDSQLLIVGLAPGLKGANQTGRPFTGDYAGDLLYKTLMEFGFAEGEYQKHAEDNLFLKDCRITNGVRCVPPKNKPTGTEIKSCAKFLEAEIKGMKNLICILALGGIAHTTVLAVLNQKRAKWPFKHAAIHHLPNLPILVDSYHCSRYNTNTGRLTNVMFNEVFLKIKKLLY